MGEQPEKTESVVGKLFEEMETTVTAYCPGAVKVGLRVEGTSFFPAGIGLWRDSEPRGKAPIDFPKFPIMILGHNWGTVRELKQAHRNGTDGMLSPSWKCLLRYLGAAEVDPEDCFFTNVFVGLQPEKSKGKMCASEEFKTQCRAFLHKQIETVKPRLVATLGADAADQYRQSGCPTAVELVHPGHACAGYTSQEDRENIIKNEAKKLRDALDLLNHRCER
jgi:hypothetical protein